MRNSDRRHRRVPTRAGLTLIEVLVALAILGMGVAGWAALAAQGIGAMEASAARESEYQQATNELARASLWSRQQFEASIGIHRLDRIKIAVAQPSPVLFAVSVTDSGGTVLLTTSFYRRDSSAAKTR